MRNKTFTILFVFLALISCGKNSNSQSSLEKKNEFAGEVVDSNPNSPVPALALSFQVKPRMINFSETQKEKVYDAADLIEKVIASEEFRKEVLNYTFKGKKRFLNNRGFSNAQIYKRILEASEKMLKKGKNNVMDIELQLYREDTTTIGYTYPNVVRVYMNTKYFEHFSSVQVSDNMMHEWLHKIGFDHAIKYSPDRDHSVPYAIGYIVKRLAKRYVEQAQAQQQ